MTMIVIVVVVGVVVVGVVVVGVVGVVGHCGVAPLCQSFGNNQELGLRSCGAMKLAHRSTQYTNASPPVLASDLVPPPGTDRHKMALGYWGRVWSRSGIFRVPIRLCSFGPVPWTTRQGAYLGLFSN